MSEGTYYDDTVKQPGDAQYNSEAAQRIKRNAGLLGKVYTVEQCATEPGIEPMPSLNPRDLLDRRIRDLNEVTLQYTRELHELQALRRGLPSEMAPLAERALLSLLRKAGL